MRARRVRARAYYARASILQYPIPSHTITPAHAIKHPAPSHQPGLQLKPPPNSYLQHTTTAARGKCSRLCSVQAEFSGQFLPRLQSPTTTSPQQAGHAMQKPGKSSGFCMILTEILQKWGHAVYFIGHNVNDIRPKMQARRHDCRTPPILQAWKPPKIGEWDKHFSLHACSPIRHKRGRPEFLPRMIRRKPEKPVNRLQTRVLGFDGLNIDSRYTFCNVGYGRRFLFACVGGGRGVFSKPESKFRNGWGHTPKK